MLGLLGTTSTERKPERRAGPRQKSKQASREERRAQAKRTPKRGRAAGRAMGIPEEHRGMQSPQGDAMGIRVLRGMQWRKPGAGSMYISSVHNLPACKVVEALSGTTPYKASMR